MSRSVLQGNSRIYIQQALDRNRRGSAAPDVTAHAQFFNEDPTVSAVMPPGTHALAMLDNIGPAAYKITQFPTNKTFIVDEAGIYEVGYSYEIGVDGNPNDLTIGVAVNGHMISQGKTRERFTTPDRRMLASTCQVSLLAGDAVRLLYGITNGGTITSEFNTFWIKRIG